MVYFPGVKKKIFFNPCRDLSKWPKDLHPPPQTTINVSFDGDEDKALFIIQILRRIFLIVWNVANENLSIIIDINHFFFFGLTRSFF